jgi:pyruvate dehydrogenase E1 component alpha subunit
MAKVEQQAIENIEKAVEFAKESPEPSVESVTEDVYA